MLDAETTRATQVQRMRSIISRLQTEKEVLRHRLKHARSNYSAAETPAHALGQRASYWGKIRSKHGLRPCSRHQDSNTRSWLRSGEDYGCSHRIVGDLLRIYHVNFRGVFLRDGLLAFLLLSRTKMKSYCICTSFPDLTHHCYMMFMKVRPHTPSHLPLSFAVSSTFADYQHT